MKIDMKEVYEQKTALSNSKTSIDAQLKTAKTSFVNLVHSESLKGDVKGAINAKITNHQVPLLTNFTNVLAVLLAQYEKTIKQFQSTVSENAVDAIIDTEYLQGLLDGFSGLSMNISVVNRETERIYSSISDIISLTNPDASTITTPLSEGKKILTDTKTNMASFNGWKRGDEYSKVLQSQTQTLESLSTMAGLSFTDAEAKAFYNSQDYLKAVKKISSKADGSTPVELLGLVSKTINEYIGKQDAEAWSYWNNKIDTVGNIVSPVGGKIAGGKWSIGTLDIYKGVRYASSVFRKSRNNPVSFLNGTVFSRGGAQISDFKILGKSPFKNESKLGKFFSKFPSYEHGTINRDLNMMSENASSFSAMTKVGKFFKIAGWTGTAIDVASNISDLKSKGFSNEQTAVITARRTAVDMASSAVGSNLGRLAGAAIGQVVCPIPGVGAALGAVAGSIIGSAVGSWAGSAINKELDRNIKPKKQGWSWPW